jgi:single-strand DNA-binding protein
MTSFNKVILAGNLTRDVEVRKLTSGTSVATLGLASNRNFTVNGEKKEETLFVDVEVWGKTAELCGEYLSKGRNILVEGRLKLDSWEDADGKKRSKVLVTAESVQFLSSGKSKNDDVEMKNETTGDTPF